MINTSRLSYYECRLVKWERVGVGAMFGIQIEGGISNYREGFRAVESKAVNIYYDN